MSNQIHPDPELLNAFIEGLLPEPERLQCISHFAECARCRDIIFLAQPAIQAVPAISPVKKRWYWSTAAIAASAAIVILSLYRHQPSETKMLPRVDVQSEHVPVTTPQPSTAADRDSILVVRAKKVEPKSVPPPPNVETPTAITARVPTNKPLLAPPPISVDLSTEYSNVDAADAIPSKQALQQSANGRSLPKFIPLSRATVAQAQSEIKGKVTDASGAPVPNATVTAQAVGATSRISATTDTAGNFVIAGLPPGQYEIQIESKGFARSASRLELKPNQVAEMAAKLEVGNVASTVEVLSSSLSVNLQPALSTTISIGTKMLAIDPAGALYFRPNPSKRWKLIRPKWKGKVTQIIVLPPDAAPLFELTTDSGDPWLSEDGTHWHRQKK